MTGALIILAVTVAVGIILYLTRGRNDDGQAQASGSATGSQSSAGRQADADGKSDTGNFAAADGQADPNRQAVAEDEAEVCCGRHAVCEKGLLKAEELYYNDEELDRFAGKAPQDYATEEIEEFREVLYTLRPAEVYQWGVALTQRNIALPLDLRDEWVMLCQ